MHRSKFLFWATMVTHKWLNIHIFIYVLFKNRNRKSVGWKVYQISEPQHYIIKGGHISRLSTNYMTTPYHIYLNSYNNSWLPTTINTIQYIQPPALLSQAYLFHLILHKYCISNIILSTHHYIYWVLLGTQLP